MSEGIDIPAAGGGNPYGDEPFFHDNYICGECNKGPDECRCIKEDDDIQDIGSIEKGE